MPRFLSEAEVAAGLPELDQPAPTAGRLTVTSPTRFRLGDGELVGDALLWDGARCDCRAKRNQAS